MKASYACEGGIEGDAKVDQLARDGRVRGRVYLYTSRPKSLRLDLESPPPFQSIVATLTSDGTHFALSDQRAKRFYFGPAATCNIARLTEVPIEPRALVTLLGGEAPLLTHHNEDLTLGWSGQGHYVVRIPSVHEAVQEIGLEPEPDDFTKPWTEQRLRVVTFRVEQQGIELYRAELSEHAPAVTAPPRIDPDGIDPPIAAGPMCRAMVPRKIRIEVPPTGQDVLFRYEKVVLNPPLPPGVYVQRAAPGLQSTFVECR